MRSLARNTVLTYALLSAAASVTAAFVIPTRNHVVFTSNNNNRLSNQVTQHKRPGGASTLSMMSSNESNTNKKVVVISPPGGLGEIAAVSAAKSGGSVRWFVVSSAADGPSSSSSSKFSLSEETLSAINAAGGSFDFAGADAPSLILSPDQAESAVGAVGKWCGSSDAVICTIDGIDEETAITGVKRDREVIMKEAENRKILNDAVKVAAREAANLCSADSVRVALQPLEEAGEEEEEESGGAGGLLKSFLGGGNDVPSSLTKALEGANAGAAAQVTVLRHGDLFGVPESSSEASPFVGGPRRDPILRDEITMRSIRLDPTISVYGTTLKGDSKRSSRLSMGDAAALMALQSVKTSNGLDLVLSSFPGLDIPSAEEWEAEFVRVQDAMSSGAGGAGAQLFSQSFASIPSKTRLADWLATKWAPAILRTYDIAGTRVGARPVYAARVGESSVEIVWQKLVDFQTVLVGKMIIDVTDDNAIVAKRGAGDASAGYGSVSTKPLAGEDVLVSRLADASSQAVEKGLATKASVTKKEKTPKKEVAAPAVTSTVASSGTVAAASATSERKPSRETGPRTAGARRSAERTRGKRRKKSATATTTPAPAPKDGAETSSSESWQ
uniref:Uncharacterized protein n=1 Tax=Helicotheca tamesis TaxID=374047 RepID=A0A7S2MTU8_9STRA|mmetsp:Transcript_324/g.372  ORF Transcript_324/g.372 Transcript_324/m.372 type:complete len:615 (+) Transcript_324:163-2007(+)|eukprot:CAMPEP_0185725146 /NCGR_PEP_ID=MMETSP1171-20130828/1456_1 /TAXON_ID=374046 /ORGANISM="Helicotheca tamensis, Strain CCMP826" /LENGTH=614 /DNA_ID=CAMNT_0028393183 /DNA_START=99 /DNA_END=1943 /DNA_ORIENTATION=+